MIPFFVSPEGVPLENGKNTPTPSQEVGTAETTSMVDLCREAAKQAVQSSTRKKC